MNFLSVNNIHLGHSEDLINSIEPETIALSFWSPPYFVGKQYERDLDFEKWKKMLSTVIAAHFRILKPGGFLVINIADIRCFRDMSIPKFQALNPSRQRSKITKDMILDTKAKFPQMNRYQLASHLGCSEQTIDRRLNGNNIRGGKYEIQTRVNLVGGMLQEFAQSIGLFCYDHRIWVKDPAWANCRWTSNSLKAVDEFEDLYIFWKPGQQVFDRKKLSDSEWKEWGMRGVWYINSVRVNDDHEAKFPIELASRVVRLYSDPGDIVLDPFIGSGTTAIAAIQNNRDFIGIDKEANYVELSSMKIVNWKKQLSLDL